MSGAFDAFVTLAREERRRNRPLPILGRPILVVQNPDDIALLLRDKEQRTEKFLDWIRQVTGPSRITENGETWAVRQSISQPFFASYDRARLSRIGRAVLADNEQALAASRERVDNRDLYRIVLDVFFRFFLNTSVADSGLDAPLMHRMVLHAAGNSALSREYLHAQSDAERRAKLQALLDDRAAVLRSFGRFRDPAAFDSGLLRNLRAADAQRIGVHFETELLTVISAGTESTAATFGWGLYLAAEEPAFQARIAAPADAGAEGKRNEAAELLLNEALRRFPGFPIVARFATEEIALSEGRIEKGQPFIISLLGGHWNGFEEAQPSLEALFQDRAGKPPGHFTFGAGRRVCGGRAFAMQELRELLTGTLTRFTARLSGESYTAAWQLALVPERGQPVTLTPRATAQPSP